MNAVQRTFARVLLRLIFPCTDVTRLVSESMDGTLPFFKRLRVRSHLYLCVWCRRFSEQLSFLRDALRRHPERLEHQDIPPPSGLSPEARHRLKQALSSPER